MPRLVRPLTLGPHCEVWVARERGRDVIVRRYDAAARSGPPGPWPLPPDPQVLQALNGPGVNRFLDASYDEEGALLLAFEHLDGRSLAAVLRGGPLPPGQVQAMVDGLAPALDRLHRGTAVSPRLHGDVSPGNILALDGGGFVLVDLLATPPGEYPAGPGIVFGTLPYLASSVLAGEAPSEAADRESLAWVAVAAATGKLPWAAARSPVEVLDARRERPLETLCDPLPPGLRAAILALALPPRR